MPRFRVSYRPEFRAQMVELVRAGRTPQDLARGFEPNTQSIAHWVRPTDREAGASKAGGTGGAEREELGRLRHENPRLCQERLWAVPRAWQGRRPSDCTSDRAGQDPVRVGEFLSAHQAEFPTRVMVRVLLVSASGHYA
jgi:transposase